MREYAPELPTAIRYDNDEVLIFAGKFADQEAHVFFDRLRSDWNEEVRNAMADAAEDVMRDWKGEADVPLPRELTAEMRSAAYLAGLGRISDLVDHRVNGGEGF